MNDVIWYQIRGYEGLYEMTADGLRVRTVARTWRYGNTLRTWKSKPVRRNKESVYVLRDHAGIQHRIQPHQLLSMIGEAVNAD